jgi:hypothetical protein
MKRENRTTHPLAKLTITSLIAATLASTYIPVQRATAQIELSAVSQQQQTPVRIAQTGEGTRITLTASTSTARDAGGDVAFLSGLPRIRLGDLNVPGQLVTVILPTALDAVDATRAANASGNVESVPFAGSLAAVTEALPVPIPTLPNGEQYPDLRRDAVITLPENPVSVVNVGTLRGVRLAVLAISPLFMQSGETRLATALDITLPGTQVIENTIDLLGLFDITERATKTLPGVQPAASTVNCADTSYQPANQQARAQAWRIRVSRTGMHEIKAASLSTAGMSLPVPFANLRLTYRGQVLAIRRFGAGDGQLGAGDAFRFYAPDPGDRWNSSSVYWLSIENSAAQGSPEMGVAGAPAVAPGASVAGLQRGTFTNDKIYDATSPGVDGDHWFAADLKAANGTAATWSFSPPVILPYLGSGGTIIRVGLMGKTNSNHALTLGSNGQTANTTVSGIGTHTATFSLAGDFVGASTFSVQPQPSNAPEVVLPDRVTWERNVSLSFGGNGARFAINAAGATYQAINSTVGSQGNDALYDVTNPNAPVVMLMSTSGTSAYFQHAGGNRTYVMAGAGTLFSSDNPGAGGAAVSSYAYLPMDSAFNYNAVYISPIPFRTAANTLVNHRRAQGYAAGFFDVESIYDWWSFGEVSPQAIRNFMRHAYCTWSVKPAAVTMFGDGTIDPFDRYGYGETNVNVIPPYVAPVDPYLTTSLGAAETACEACYAQLDGADPLSDKLADLYYGRLPAKTAAEATALVNKIISYDTAAFTNAPSDGGWRRRVAYVADNYRQSDGSTDSAGNFESFAEVSIAAQPKSLLIQRMYYDPLAAASDGVREKNANTAHERVKGIFNAGAGLINYMGHANLAQMAVTDGAPGYLLFLTDPDGMNNTAKLPVVLQMTCLTSAFQTPVQYYGTSIDERLVLTTNGAVATWGSSSLGVTYSHDAMMKGFYNALWAGPTFRTPIGQAAAGGYAELFAQSAGVPQVDNLLYTFMVMGDPLTQLRVGGSGQNLPIMNRNTRR